jgi:hypothetical protein
VSNEQQSEKAISPTCYCGYAKAAHNKDGKRVVRRGPMDAACHGYQPHAEFWAEVQAREPYRFSPTITPTTPPTTQPGGVDVPEGETA